MLGQGQNSVPSDKQARVMQRIDDDLVLLGAQSYGDDRLVQLTSWRDRILAGGEDGLTALDEAARNLGLHETA
jgi:hypothetical protein